MSDLFNFLRILNEDTSSILIRPANSTNFLSNGIDIMREADESVFNITSILHRSLTEAQSVKEENVKFADFFKEYKKVIEKYIMQARALVSQFSINVETFADANKDIDCKADFIQAPLYTGIEYDNLLNDEVPNIKPYKAFKKEFAFIGKLLQDLGPVASEEQKVQIIATVCNNLSREIETGWIDKCIKKITDNDDCDKDGFAKSIYNKFVKDKAKQMTIDIGLAKQSKLAIVNYRSYITCINKSIDEFCDGLQQVADEIGSMFFRNQDHKLPIKTDIEGIQDKTYRLNDYSFNQMNIFITTKISQITELCNLYIIALSIKMDCIYKFLQQCKDIIDTINAGVDNTPNVEPRDNNSDTEDGVEDYDEDIEDFNADNDNTDENSKEPEHDESETEFEQECYLFEAQMYQQERLINSLIYKESMYNCITEEAEGAPAVTNISKTKALKAIIDNLVKQISTLAMKFKQSINDNYNKQIGFIQSNKGRIEKAVIPDGWTIRRLRIDDLLKFKVPDFSETDIPLLQEKDKYIDTKYSNILTPGEGSVKDKILKKYLSDKEEKYTNDDRTTGLNFVLNQYKAALTTIDNAVNTIKSAQGKTNSIAQQAATESAESMYEEAMRMYFTEDKSEIDQNAKEKNAEQNPQQVKNATKTTAAKQYFTINTSVITAIMNIYNTMMKKHLRFLTQLAKLNGASVQNTDDSSQQKSN